MQWQFSLTFTILIVDRLGLDTNVLLRLLIESLCREPKTIQNIYENENFIRYFSLGKKIYLTLHWNFGWKCQIGSIFNSIFIINCQCVFTKKSINTLANDLPIYGISPKATNWSDRVANKKRHKRCYVESVGWNP